MSVRNLESLFEPELVAVIGASKRQGSVRASGIASGEDTSFLPKSHASSIAFFDPSEPSTATRLLLIIVLLHSTAQQLDFIPRTTAAIDLNQRRMISAAGCAAGVTSS
ncbi:MAG: hypothetical protein R3337_01555 [Gammaproteobacteria bacterium]|nr:hypothetical protein [Gammaproteobacteria bacterium]